MKDDLVSKAVVIDAICDEFSKVYCNNCDYKSVIGDPCDDCDRKNMKWSAERNTVERVVGELPSAQQWIPCSERLPENSDFYLVTVEWWDGKRFTEDCSYDHEYKVWNDGEYDDYGAVVIAWMEKPEPWEGGQNEQN